MSHLTCPDNVIESMRQRRGAGESLAKLAKEVGLSWQRLWTLLDARPAGVPKPPPVQAVQRSAGAGPLTERYRPRTLDALFGQEPVVRMLKNFAASPYPSAFIFEGETGTGKTSAALGLAAALGCDVEQKPQEFGGVHVVASGEQTADTVRELEGRMWRTPFYGSGWKTVIVNEADRMSSAVETIWLDRLESLPPRTVIVFTTNYAGKLSQRFRDRCTRLGFESQAGKIGMDTYSLLASIWRNETGSDPDMSVIARVVEQATEDGQLSFRRAVQLLTPVLMSEKGKP